ncbi:MAG: hypothetical protein DMF82_06265 [Acidobacteria bacterium]|nr:MAG: hypothetical protein DMF82_06265 [Acidobacteriota bacterium]
MSVKSFAVLLLKYGSLVLALLVTAALSAMTTMRVVLRSQDVVVPSLVGRRVPEAGPLAARHRLLLRVEGRRHDPRVPADASGRGGSPCRRSWARACGVGG